MESRGELDKAAGLGQANKTVNPPRVSITQVRAPEHVSAPLAVSLGHDFSEEPIAELSGPCFVRDLSQHAHTGSAQSLWSCRCKARSSCSEESGHAMQRDT